MPIQLLQATSCLFCWTETPSPRESLLVAVAATMRSLELVRTQYMAGLTDFQNVLDTQRSLFSQQDELAATEGRVVQDLIAIYKAVGGGWAEDAERPETFTIGARPD